MRVTMWAAGRRGTCGGGTAASGCGAHLYLVAYHAGGVSAEGAAGVRAHRFEFGRMADSAQLSPLRRYVMGSSAAKCGTCASAVAAAAEGAASSVLERRAGLAVALWSALNGALPAELALLALRLAAPEWAAARAAELTAAPAAPAPRARPRPRPRRPPPPPPPRPAAPRPPPPPPRPPPAPLPATAPRRTPPRRPRPAPAAAPRPRRRGRRGRPRRGPRCRTRHVRRLRGAPHLCVNAL